MAKKIRTEVSASAAADLAREFADWRIGGCPGYGFAEGFKARLGKVARSHGQSPSELYAVVHRLAYAIIDEAGIS